MQVTPASLAATFYGFNTLFQNAMQSAQPVLEPALATRMPSNGEGNVYAWMTKLLAMREWLGDRVAQNVGAKSYTLNNKQYELTLEVDRKKMADDQLGIYTPILQEMGAQTKLFLEDRLVEAVQAGVTNVTYDAVAFFATNHPVDPDGRVAGTQSNKLTAADLDETTYEAARVAMANFKGPDGRPLGTMGRTLLVPPQLETKAKKLVKNEFNASGATNVYQGSATVVVAPQLANEPTTWYLIDNSRVIKPFVTQLREAPNFVQMTAADSESVFKRDQFLFGSSARGAAGYGPWFLAVRCSP